MYIYIILIYFHIYIYNYIQDGRHAWLSSVPSCFCTALNAAPKECGGSGGVLHTCRWQGTGWPGLLSGSSQKVFVGYISDLLGWVGLIHSKNWDISHKKDSWLSGMSYEAFISLLKAVTVRFQAPKVRDRPLQLLLKDPCKWNCTKRNGSRWVGVG